MFVFRKILAYSRNLFTGIRLTEFLVIQVSQNEFKVYLLQNLLFYKNCCCKSIVLYSFILVLMSFFSKLNISLRSHTKLGQNTEFWKGLMISINEIFWLILKSLSRWGAYDRYNVDLKKKLKSIIFIFLIFEKNFPWT